MRVNISGHQMDVGEALQAHADSKLQSLQGHIEGLKEAHIVFSQQGHHHNLHHAAVTAHAGSNGHGLVLHAEGSGIDIYAALDDAVGKLARQLEKYKGRLAKHRERRQKFKEHLKDMGPLMSMESMSVTDLHLEDAPNDMFANHASDVVKKDVDKMNPMTVDEAVMQMDLLHKPAFLFLNVSSGKLNMVYREGEAQVRWVAPK